jgi:multimeric flavodoxin WrbA
MKSNLYLICPNKPTNTQLQLYAYAFKGKQYTRVESAEDLSPVANGRIIFSVHLDKSGIDIELFKMLKKISLSKNQFFKNSTGAVIVLGDSELYTKSILREIIFHLNLAGVSFMGRPVVEATSSMKNLAHIAMEKNLSLMDTLFQSAKDLVDRLLSDGPPKKEKPELLVLHSSNYKTSNTLMLWQEVKQNLSSIKITEIHIENGSVRDCIGCPFKTCKHYGEQKRCYYGGIMVTDIYPAVLECDSLMLLCPNYNDSISANLSAMINRLTALFRLTQFYDKYLFSIIVSGHSGSDLIAKQLISSLCINKTFRLASGFSMMETANDPGDILKLIGIEERAKAFAENILSTLT